MKFTIYIPFFLLTLIIHPFLPLSLAQLIMIQPHHDILVIHDSLGYDAVSCIIADTNLPHTKNGLTIRVLNYIILLRIQARPCVHEIDIMLSALVCPSNT